MGQAQDTNLQHQSQMVAFFLELNLVVLQVGLELVRDVELVAQLGKLSLSLVTALRFLLVGLADGQQLLVKLLFAHARSLAQVHGIDRRAATNRSCLELLLKLVAALGPEFEVGLRLLE